MVTVSFREAAALVWLSRWSETATPKEIRDVLRYLGPAAKKIARKVLGPGSGLRVSLAKKPS
jgi:hypothetical protein